MTRAIPRFPAFGASLMSVLPLAPLTVASRRLVASLAARHPELFERLGPQAQKTYLLDADDLPLVFLLRPRPERPTLDVYRRGDAPAWDARVAGRLAALLGMLHGAFDGDALFFSSDLVIEGDTEAVLALRNAVDNAEIDLPAEIAAMVGPFAPVLATPMRHILPVAERISGVTLSRAGTRVP